MNRKIRIGQGAGGRAMRELVEKIRALMRERGGWSSLMDDAAVLEAGKKSLVFTTDTYTVQPLFFPGGDIGKMAACGTINDLAVTGARPIALSCSLVIEEGFPEDSLGQIVRSMNRVSKAERVPVVTGDTKVVEKGEVDGLIVNTSGIGVAEKVLKDDCLKAGDIIIVSGTMGDHGTALLAKRFGLRSSLVSDCAPLTRTVQSVINYVTVAKDPTRGGLASSLNELAAKSCVRIMVDEASIPVRREVRAAAELLGIDPLSIANEGKAVFGCPAKHADMVVRILKRKDRNAAVIGKVVKGERVIMKTLVGEKFLDDNIGDPQPRIC